MKPLFTTCFFSLLFSILFSQNLNAQNWEKSIQFDHINPTTVSHIEYHGDEFYAMFNIQNEYALNNQNFSYKDTSNILIHRFNKAGEIIQTYILPGENIPDPRRSKYTFRGYTFKVDPEQNIYLIHSNRENYNKEDNSFEEKLYLTKFASEGTVEWKKDITNSNDISSPCKMEFDSFGYLYIVINQSFLIKLDSEGEEIISKKYANFNIQELYVGDSSLFIGGQSGFLFNDTLQFEDSVLVGKNSSLIAELDFSLKIKQVIPLTTNNINYQFFQFIDIDQDSLGNTYALINLNNKFCIYDTCLPSFYFESLIIFSISPDYELRWISNISSKSKMSYSNKLVMKSGKDPMILFSLDDSCTLNNSYKIAETSGTAVITLNPNSGTFKEYNHTELISPKRTSVNGNGQIVSLISGDFSTAHIQHNYINTLHPDLSIDAHVTRQIPNFGSVSIEEVLHDNEGNTYLYTDSKGNISYHTKDIYHKEYEPHLSKFDFHNNLIWDISFKGANAIKNRHMTALDSKNSILFTSTFTDTLQIESNVYIPTKVAQVFVSKFSPEGKLLWNKIIDEQSFRLHHLNLDTDKNDNIYLEFLNGKNEFTIIKLSPNGEILWKRNQAFGYFPETEFTVDSKGNSSILFHLRGYQMNIPKDVLKLDSIQLDLRENNDALVLLSLNTKGIFTQATKFDDISKSNFQHPIGLNYLSDGNLLIYASTKTLSINDSLFKTADIETGSHLSYLHKVTSLGESVHLKVVDYETINHFYSYGKRIIVDTSDNIYLIALSNDISELDTIIEYSDTSDIIASHLIKYDSDLNFEWNSAFSFYGNRYPYYLSLALLDEDRLSLGMESKNIKKLGDIEITGDQIVATIGKLPYTLNVSNSQLQVTYQDQSSVEFELFTEIDWELELNSDWLTIDQSSGTGNTTLTFTADLNSAPITRQDTSWITIHHTDSKTGENLTSTKMIVVIQDEYGLSVSEIQSNFIYLIQQSQKKLVIKSEQIPTNIELFDAQGKLLESIGNSNQMDLNGISSGVYIFRTILNGSISSNKFWLN